MIKRKGILSVFVIFIVLFLVQVSYAAIINGGFETGDFSGWSTTQSIGGNLAVVQSYILNTLSDGSGDDIIFLPYEGNYMAVIGSESAETNWNVFNQLIQLDPQWYDAPVLSFAYNFWSYDYEPWDSPGFQVLVNGTPVFSLSPADIDTDGENGGLDYTGWQVVTIDLCPYLNGIFHGNITIDFMAGDTGDEILRTGVFLDNIEIRNVPLPSSLLFLASGMLGIFGLRRKR
ncbi:MAG: hypothetical protein DRP09_18160 [Candidatus Thorarchaeota archaeon]|nr:MAG: hypothetical protein DRP09_18160 [Candidatus Thorarchaeota archaeon]